MRPLQHLDPTWWRKVPGGYDQQGGRARLVRLKQRTRVTGWALYVDGEYRGDWPKLEQAKRRAAEITAVTATVGTVPGYSNFGGGGPLAPMSSPRPNKEEPPLKSPIDTNALETLEQKVLAALNAERNSVRQQIAIQEFRLYCDPQTILELIRVAKGSNT